jgi:hypothetical protein
MGGLLLVLWGELALLLRSFVAASNGFPNKQFLIIESQKLLLWISNVLKLLWVLFWALRAPVPACAAGPAHPFRDVRENRGAAGGAHRPNAGYNARF